MSVPVVEEARQRSEILANFPSYLAPRSALAASLFAFPDSSNSTLSQSCRRHSGLTPRSITDPKNQALEDVILPEWKHGAKWKFDSAGSVALVRFLFPEDLDLEQGISLFLLKVGFDESDGIAVFGNHIVTQRVNPLLRLALLLQQPPECGLRLAKSGQNERHVSDGNARLVEARVRSHQRHGL